MAQGAGQHRAGGGGGCGVINIGAYSYSVVPYIIAQDTYVYYIYIYIL